MSRRRASSTTASAAARRRWPGASSNAHTGGAMRAVIAISRRSWSISITTHFFGREHEGGRVDADLVGYVQAARPAGSFELVRTLHIDLTPGRDRLYADLGKSTRNQVNRAIREDAL